MNKSESKYFNTAKKMDLALISLLKKKSFEYVTVSEICEKAGVNRSTFYLHYETVDDLLNETRLLLSKNEEAREYLERSGALFGTPIERLRKMNEGAIKLYADNGIDLYSEYLEIAVCAQHANGGVLVDENWQSEIKGLYSAGEAAGTFGEYRPGGSALNSTQV